MSYPKKPSSAPIEPSSSNNNNNIQAVDEENLNLQAPAFERLLQNHSPEEEKVCRICLEEDNPETMIAPCLCKGGSKWVHRECLDEWRTNEKDRAFSKCTECLFEYHLQSVDNREGSSDCADQCCKPQTKRQALFYWMVSRDACLGIVLQQIIIVALAALLLACDPNHELPGLLQQTMKGSSSLPTMSQSTMVWVYYAFGWFTFFMGLGLYGSVVICMNGCDVQRSIPRVGPPSEADQEPAQAGPTMSPFSNPPPPPPTTSNSPNRYYNYSSMDRNSDGSYHSHPRSSRSSSTTFYRRARRRHYHRRRHHYYNDYYYGPTYYPMYVYPGNDGCCCCYCCCDSGTHHSGCGGDGCLRGCGHLGGIHSSISGGSSSSGDSSSSGGSSDGQHILLMVLLVVAIVLAIIGFFVGVVVVVVASQRIVSRHIYLLQKRQLVQEFRVMDLQDFDLDKPIDDSTTGENNDPNGIEMQPSAPVMPTEDVQYLQKLGLMDR